MRPHVVLVVLASSLALASCKHGGSTERAGGAAAQQKSTGIPAFAGHARFIDAKVSPKGTYLAAVSVEGGKRALAFIDLTTKKPDD